MSDTLAEIRSATYDRAGIPEGDEVVPVAMMDRFINAALRRTSTTFDPYWLETSGTLTTTADVNYVALSGLGSFHKMSRVEYDDSVLKMISKHEIAQYLSYTAGIPVLWAVERERLRLAPTPDAAYALTCYYYRIEDVLDEESSQPLLPAQYTDWLVCEAGIMAAIKNRDEKMVAFLKGERDDWFRKIRDDIRQVRGMPRVRVREDR